MISNRAKKLTESPLQQFFAKAKAMIADGSDMISLGVGEPDNHTPWRIKLAGIWAILKNMTGYLPAVGSPELRKILAEKYGVGVPNVVVSHGAKTTLSAVLWSIINPGDQVMVLTPYYPPFLQVVESCGGEVIIIDTKSRNFIASAQEIKLHLSRIMKPKALILNSPNNPTGMEYPLEELKKIVQLSKQYGFRIIADECYSHFSENPDFSLHNICPEAIVIGSCSKTYSMPGWRVGWGVMPAELASAVRLFLENYIGSPNSISVAAATVALRGNGIHGFEKQRKMVYDWLDTVGIPYEKSTGGFYVFPDFSKYTRKIDGSVALAEHLLNFGVTVTPGVSFGENFDNFLRISFCVKKHKLQEALLRLEKGLQEI